MPNRNLGYLSHMDGSTIIKPDGATKSSDRKQSPDQARPYNVKLSNLEQKNAALTQENIELKGINSHLEGQLKTFDILLKEFERQFKLQEQNFEKRFETAIKSITSESINWRNQYQDEIGRLISSSTEQFARLHHRFYRIMKREAYLTEKLKRQRENINDK